MEDAVNDMLSGETAFSGDEISHDNVVGTKLSNQEPILISRQDYVPDKCDNRSILKMCSNVLTSGKAGFFLRCNTLKLHSTDHPSLLHLLPIEWLAHSAFEFIPTFHVICTTKKANSDKNMSLTINLVAFCGKPVIHQRETVTFALTDDGESLDEAFMVEAFAKSKLLTLFAENKFQLCRGVNNCQKIQHTLQTHGLESGKYMWIILPKYILHLIISVFDSKFLYHFDFRTI